MQRNSTLSKLALGALGLSLIAPAAFAQEAATQQADAPAQADAQQIIVGPVNVYSFQPPEAEGEAFDIDELNLRLVFESLDEDSREWYQHVMTLSNPYFEGRAPGLAGNRHAADYIEFWMREYNLEPAFPEPEAEEIPGGGVNQAWTSYRQPFDVRDRATDNVGGVLRGRGDLADEWIVIGAHYDHVGYGNRNSLDKEHGRLHPGADDNASGTAGMLVLARRLRDAYSSAVDQQHLRSILFLGFSAEEMGLVGSRHYTRNSTIDAEKIQIMLNLDMIGRLRNDTMMVGGVESAESLLEIIRPTLLESGLTIYAEPSGRGPSDHANFYGAGVPVLFMFTGTHSVYHQPGDFGWTVNPQGAARIIDMTAEIAMDMAAATQRLKYKEQQFDRGGRGRGGAVDGAPQRVAGGSRARLGITPDWQTELEAGVKVGEVFDDSAAARAGVQVGDIILTWNGEAVNGLRELFTKLREASPGDEITILITRDGEEQQLKLKLDEG